MALNDVFAKQTKNHKKIYGVDDNIITMIITMRMVLRRKASIIFVN